MDFKGMVSYIPYYHNEDHIRICHLKHPICGTLTDYTVRSHFRLRQMASARGYFCWTICFTRYNVVAILVLVDGDHKSTTKMDFTRWNHNAWNLTYQQKYGSDNSLHLMKIHRLHHNMAVRPLILTRANYWCLSRCSDISLHCYKQEINLRATDIKGNDKN